MVDVKKYHEALHCVYCSEIISDCEYYETDEGQVHADCYEEWVQHGRKTWWDDTI